MSNDYDDWEYHNVCPWCYGFYSDDPHHLGCPNPTPYEEMDDRQKKLKEFCEFIYAGGLLDEIPGI